MSFLRKQESRFIPAQVETQAIGGVTFWIPAFAGETRTDRGLLSTDRGDLIPMASSRYSIGQEKRRGTL